jgi:hypothetical protein
MTLALLAALFVTARGHNGWTGLHELASGTRVVGRSAARLRTRTAPAAATAIDDAALALGTRYGPFRAVTDVRNGNPNLVVGFDPVLRRQVWIHEVPRQTAPIAAERRALSRTGRLHWLTGRRSGGDNWDAFEAPDGQPFLLALRGPALSWSTLKSWLLDLSTELVASAKDGSMPALRLDRLWIRGDGRLVLLDFEAPALGQGQGAGPSPGQGAGPGPMSPVQLLSAVADWSAPAEQRSQMLMPLSARTLIQSWSQTPPSLPDAHAELARVAARPDQLRRARRALPMVLAAIPPLFIVVFTVLIMVPAVDRFFGPDTNEMLGFLETLYNPRPNTRQADPEVRAAIETYVAGRHGTRLRDAGFWNSPVMQGVSNRLRKTAEGVAARHPSVSSEELARATTTIAPELERQRQRRERSFADLAGIIIMATVAAGMLLLLLLSIVSSLIVPGGLFSRLLGHAVVTRAGEIGRGLSLARVLVAWSPAIAWLLYLASMPKVQGFVPTPPNPLLGTILTLAALGIGAVLTIVKPERGPHDWLLGTRVVPR